MVQLSLALWGPFEARLDGQPITDFESARARAMLAYLAAESGRSHHRETLASLLWPDWPQTTALTNLRAALARLRRTIGDRDAAPPFLQITRETIAFCPESEHEVDVARFGALVGHMTCS